LEFARHESVVSALFCYGKLKQLAKRASAWIGGVYWDMILPKGRAWIRISYGQFYVPAHFSWNRTKTYMYSHPVIARRKLLHLPGGYFHVPEKVKKSTSCFIKIKRK